MNRRRGGRCKKTKVKKESCEFEKKTEDDSSKSLRANLLIRINQEHEVQPILSAHSVQKGVRLEYRRKQMAPLPSRCSRYSQRDGYVSNQLFFKANS